MKEAVKASQSSPAPTTPGAIRFGNFEMDTRAGELRRGGVKLKLSGQPFDVLLALLEKPGQVVTREELHDKLWSQDTFVDFEQGLNKAINKVREALGDNADNPRFIETLPRRGYRFLAPVTRLGDAALSVVEDALGDPAVRPSPSTPTIRSKFSRNIWISVLAVSVLVAGVALLTISTDRSPKVLRYTQLTHDGLKKGPYLVTDGSRIYFGEVDSQRRPVVAEVSAVGGTVTTVATLPGVFPCPLDYSQARSELLAFSCVNQSPLWALSIPGGASPRRVGNSVIDDAAWTADGQSIIFTSGQRIEIMRADGSDPRTLATVAGNPAFTRVSADGKILRFTLLAANSVSPNFYSLWEMGTDGSNPHPLLPGRRTASEFGGSWTPDGKYFIYGSALPDGRQSIFAIREKKSLFGTRAPQPVELTAGPLSFSPHIISRDGKQIFAGGYLDRGELMRYDRRLRTWIPYLSGISAADVDFSHDGEWLTYVLVPEGTLWRSRVDGSQRVQLTISPLRASMPRWSPDGKRIVFTGLKPGGAWTLYLVSAEGGEPEQLFTDNKFYGDPNWSPAGNRLVFGESAEDPKAIHILDLESRRVVDLPGSKGLFSPRWSPDGNSILALSANIPLFPQPRSQPLPIRLMSFDLQQQTWQELFESAFIAYPTFSRDGKYIYFSDSSAAFYRIGHSGGRVETVANIDVPGGIKQDDFWLWTGLTPDDSPLLVRDASTREIYALDVDFP